MGASSITALRRVGESGDGLRARVAALAQQLDDDSTHAVLIDPLLCLYRFTEPSSYRKAATFGVTLGIVLQGAKHLRFGAHDQLVDGSQLLVVTRDAEHHSAIIDATPGRPFLGLSLCFGPERVARALLAMVEAGGAPARETVPFFMLDWEDGLAGSIDRLLQTLDDPLDRKLLAPLVADEILYRLLRSPAAAVVRAGVGPAGDARRILDSMRFIREHFAEKLDVARLARQAGMSLSHFAHRFRAVARVSPKRFLRQVRLDAARSLLHGNGVRVSEAAVEVGFESPAHFTREFKRQFGVSPSRLRVDIGVPAVQGR